jgi:hypothetical protein
LLIPKQNPIRSTSATKIRYYPDRLLAAGVFTLWASSFVIAATSAPIVYPGCASPPTRFNHVWYFDPVNGKTVAQYAAMNPPIPMPANGSGPTSKTQGSQQHPWNDLSALAWSNNNVKAGYKYPLLSTVPTNQYVAGVGYRFLLGSSPGAVQQAGSIQPGDGARAGPDRRLPNCRRRHQRHDPAATGDL